MEFTLSGNALKTLARSITCLSRVGTDLAIQASPSQISFHALNSSRSAYQLITFKPDLFDVFTVSGAQVQCSILLKAVCSVLRTPITNIDYLSVQLPDINASKVQWALQCFSGIKKTYWITCNVDPDIQQLSLDRRRYPSNFVVRPHDLNRLLANFQSSLQEITIIATERNSNPSDAASEFGGKAVEFQSYVDPTKENDSLLHTQLWIDPVEEFVQYTHNGNPVDVTFAVKELKAFLAFCEGCEVDIHLYFEKVGEPILMAPKFGIDEGASSNFDAMLVLATTLTSQLHEGTTGPSANGMPGQADTAEASGEQPERNRTSASEIPSNHTRICAARSVSGSDGRQVPEERILRAGGQSGIERIGSIQISKAASAEGNTQTGPNSSSLNLSLSLNWVDANEDEDDDNKDSDELCVRSTPPCYEDQ
ncbi:hypothetical protein EUGRSUZ_H04558 [Eucalyptus grandis]|uniref:Uncharacterized protein n=2 Tax=Eucalyptus grandis TaxID=71139 RepID=A0ACC3JWJ2_EUCGR|nr:hypothetical protein EUGRSUZ_H04558 [Eucalyptus grandis]